MAIAGLIAAMAIVAYLYETGHLASFFAAAANSGGGSAGSGQTPFSTDPLAPGPADAGSLGSETYNPIGAPADGSPGAIPAAKISALAQAIAFAEGEYAKIATPNVPQRANNPGDLTKSWGFPTVGVANKEGVLIFATVADGWAALNAECAAMLSGTSMVYDLGMTIFEVAQKWTGNDNPTAWASNVASKLGIRTSNTLGDFLFA